MVFLSSTLFFLLDYFLEIYQSLKYKFYLRFSPTVEKLVKQKFKKIGIEINGKNCSHIQVKDKSFYARVAAYGALGIGEAYMDKSIEIRNIIELAHKTLRNDTYRAIAGSYNLMKYFNLQTRRRALKVAESHYDLGNNLFEAMLDSNMNYTCGYWKDATNLEDAQLAKMDLIARKLDLQPGMRVLDIGCGFGGLAKYLAENYGVHIIGCTISVEQAEFGKAKFAHSNVEIRVVDYRDMKEKFDRIVSIGMFEAVGEANYTAFFKIVRNCLADDGIFLLHTIGTADKKFCYPNPWTHKYIFPNGMLPDQTLITKYINGLFYIEDWHTFGYDYSKTLVAWESNFKNAWPQLKLSFDERFYRMWTLYLATAQAMFLSRKLNLWQIVLTKNGREGGYLSVR